MTILNNPRTTEQANRFDSLNAAARTIENKNPNTAEEIQARFLKLLTAQLQNQTPDNPLDNAQMTAQFAQISMLQGMEKLNSNVERLLSNQASVAANLVGKTALVNGSTFNLTSRGSASLPIEFPDGASSVKIEVVDENGKTVFLSDFGAQPAGITSIEWDGRMTDISGNPLLGSDGKNLTVPIKDESGKPHRYSYVVTAKDEDSNVVASTPKHYENIVSISWDNKGQVIAHLQDGSKIDLDKIQQVGMSGENW